MRTMHWMTRSMALATTLALSLALGGCGGDDEGDGDAPGATPPAKTGSSPDAGAPASNAKPAGDKPAAPAATTSADTPKGAAVQMMEGVIEDDEAKFVSAFKADAQQKKALSAMHTIMSSLAQLQTKVKDKFGPEAATQLSEGNGPDIDFTTDAWRDKITATETGDTAELKMEGESQPLMATKTADGWKIDPGSMGADNPQAIEMMSKMAPMMAKVFEDTAAQVDEPGMTVDKLKQFMGQKQQEMMAAIMAEQLANPGAVPPPPGTGPVPGDGPAPSDGPAIPDPQN